MVYLLLLLILFLCELFYIKIADKFNIKDKPNCRSSHTKTTIRGGGIVFPIAAIIYAFMYPVDYLFLIGIVLVSVVSFIDDVKSISNKLRLFVQLVAMLLVFYHLSVFLLFPLWAIIAGAVVFVGILNAYNFMDGINGITGIYSLVVLFALQIINYKLTNLFINPDFIWAPIIALVVFLFFNFRKKAKCFAGDIGSISIAFWILTIIIKLILETDNLIWILLLSVYGVDTVCTICYRLFLKQNIFEAHRLHFYQILANEAQIDHRLVALLYGATQAILAVVIIYLYKANTHFILSALIVVIPLVMVYCTKFIVDFSGFRRLRK